MFVVWDCCAALLWFLFGVETRGRTLEELDEIFNASWPAMASSRKIKIAVKEGAVVEVSFLTTGSRDAPLTLRPSRQVIDDRAL